MRLVENIPLDIQIIADLITDPEDLKLVWPLARYPFDHEQWAEVLDPGSGSRPFLIYEENRLMGHAALRKTEEPLVYAVSFLYIVPQLRSKGLGRELIGLVEKYAVERLAAAKLILKVRTYNPGAFRCYSKCGFQEYGREGTLIKMSKTLAKNNSVM